MSLHAVRIYATADVDDGAKDGDAYETLRMPDPAGWALSTSSFSDR
jgi:hypothetical protein